MAGIPQKLSNGVSAIGKAARSMSVSKPASLEALKSLCQQTASPHDYPRAKSIELNIPVYDLSSASASDPESVAGLQDEWFHALSFGPGVVVLKNFFPDHDTINRSNAVFDRVIESEAQLAKGNHFATAGFNSRVWNSFQKHAEADPPSFVKYYANPWLAHVSEAWLGPSYQVTAQLNILRPGGKPQSAHRDYHLGFQTAEACARFPRTIQLSSQYLTLQGGIAHSDVPLNSGPTRLLPFSQLLPEGYMAWRLPEFAEFFNEHWVSLLPMEIVDAVFFNPALFHATGENQTTDIGRSVNLLQVSCAFGRTMETVNSIAMVRHSWEELKAFARKEGSGNGTAACISALGEGYPFPTNLDRRQPGPDGMAPTSEVDVLWEGLREDWSVEKVMKELEQLRADSSS
jgi:ectoine hydroxylase-related dioxygenase (phytanoyl-CoA dioxygenase family)